MAIADGGSLPVAICIESASPHEVRLVAKTLDSRFIPELPDRMIGDKAYDSDGLDQRLAQEYGVELIAPNRGNRKRENPQDGRPLRRYRRRWTIERLFAWLQNFRRIPIRYEHHASNYLGFLHLACIVILLRHF